MSDLQTLVHHELALLESFAALLAEERLMLEQGNADALPAIANKKTPLIEGLNNAGHQRNRWLKARGFGEDVAGVEAWLAANPAAKTLAATWQGFIATARQVRESNALNSVMLSQQLRATNEALAFLGQEAQRQALYGADGQPAVLTGNRVIDSA